MGNASTVNAVRYGTPVVTYRTGFKFAACNQIHIEHFETLIDQARAARVVGQAATRDGRKGGITAIAHTVITNIACNLGIFEHIPFKSQHISLTARTLNLSARSEIYFAFRHVKQSATGILNTLHARVVTVGFAFDVGGTEHHV